MPAACIESAVSVAPQNGIVRIEAFSALHPALVLHGALAVAATRIAAGVAAVAIGEEADADDGVGGDGDDGDDAAAGAAVAIQMPNHCQIFDERSAAHPGALHS